MQQDKGNRSPVGEKPREGTLHRLLITGYASDGAGVARLDGIVVFIQGGIRGELCDVKLTKVGRSAIWGRVVASVTPSPARAEPACPHFGHCGGCQLRHMNYAEELECKRMRVEDALRRIGGTDIHVPPVLGAPDTRRYRNKAQFPVSKGPYIGFYRPRTHQVVDVEDCLLQSPCASNLRGAVKAWMTQWGIPAYDERSGGGLVRHVYVRTNRTGEALCCLLINGCGIPRETELLDVLRAAEPALRGVVLGLNETRSNVILGESYRTLWGQDFLHDTLCGLDFKLSVPSFYQINPPQAEVLYAKAVELAGLTGQETVLDLYCGVGTISLVMARHAGQVYGAEVVPQAVDDALENARRNHIENARFLCGDAGEAARQLAVEGVRPHVVCVDPPRKGLAPDVIETVCAMGPDRVVYVSCDPGTLARDVKLFAELGYPLRQTTAVDMFPRTAHVETVILLSQQKPDDKIKVELDISDLDLTPTEAKATYPEIKEYVLEKYGLKVSSLYIAQTKQKHGIIERENYNLSKSEDAKVPQCPQVKEDAIVDALRYFKMVD